MAQRMSIVASMKQGQRGWLLRWTETDPRPPSNASVKLSHWFADVDEAMAIRDEMRRGQTFEAARQAVIDAAERQV